MGREFSPARKRKDSLAGNTQEFRDYARVNEEFLFFKVHGVFPSFGLNNLAVAGQLKTFVSQLTKVERSEALSIPGAQRSRRARKRARRSFRFMRRAELHKRD